MKVSVVIPSYKPEAYLWECLDSLCNQTLSARDYEVIVVLNGCNQPYVEHIQEYIKSHHNHFILLRQTDIPGVSNARNIGIEEVHGEYVCFVDDDDIVSPVYLESLLNVCTPTCVGCSNSYAFRNSIKDTEPNFVTPAHEECMGKSFTLLQFRKFLSAPWAKMIHKDIIEGSRFPVDMKKSEDSVFCLQISPRIKDMKLASPDAVYYQRLREGSAMRKRESYWAIIKEHLFIEYKYLSVWLKNPFKYNLKFFLSRLVACGINCLHYIKSQKKS